MMRDAESRAEDDRNKNSLQRLWNEADTLVYSVEKPPRDYGNKLSEPEKKEIEETLEKCKKLKDSSTDVSEIKSSVENLMKASHKLAERHL